MVITVLKYDTKYPFNCSGNQLITCGQENTGKCQVTVMTTFLVQLPKALFSPRILIMFLQYFASLVVLVT